MVVQALEVVAAGISCGWPTCFPANLRNIIKLVVQYAANAFRRNDKRIPPSPTSNNNRYLVDRLNPGFFGPRGREIIKKELIYYIDNNWLGEESQPTIIQQDYCIIPFIINCLIIKYIRRKLTWDDADQLRQESTTFGNILHPVAGTLTSTTRAYFQARKYTELMLNSCLCSKSARKLDDLEEVHAEWIIENNLGEIEESDSESDNLSTDSVKIIDFEDMTSQTHIYQFFSPTTRKQTTDKDDTKESMMIEIQVCYSKMVIVYKIHVASYSVYFWKYGYVEYYRRYQQSDK